MIKDPFQVSVNEQYQFSLQPDEVKDLDVVPAGEGLFHLLENGRAFRIELLEADYAARKYTLRIDGVKYRVGIADYYERLVRELGLSAGGGLKMNTVEAPMPGLVLEVLVKPGQAVQKDEPLLILEAMKMENIIKAAGEGVVKTVHAQVGLPVDKGRTLLEFE